MQPINRVCFEILKEKEAEKSTFDAAIYRVLDWLKRRPFVTDPKVVLDCDESNAQTSAGDGVFVESLGLNQDGKRGWGVRYSHPCSEHAELRWVGEVTLLDDGGERIYYQNTIGVRHTGDFVAPYEVNRSNPKLNRDILDEFKCYTKHGHRLTSSLLGLAKGENSVEVFVRILNDSKRSHPVVYVTPSNKGEPIAEVSMIAKYLAGMAHVVVAEHPDLAGEVNSRISPELGCPAGGIRIYWPDFHSNQDVHHHPLFADWQLLKMGNQYASHLVDLISRQAVLRDPEGYADWAYLQNWHYRQAVQSNQSTQQALEMLAMFEEENHKQQQALATANQEIARLTDILNKARHQVERLGGLLQNPESVQVEAMLEPRCDLEDEAHPNVEIVEEQLDAEVELESDEVQEDAEIQEFEPEVRENELPKYQPSYAAFVSRLMYEENRILNRGTDTSPPPKANKTKPDFLMVYGGKIATSGDWFEDSNYSYGRIIQINSIEIYDDNSDGNKVWIYGNGNGVGNIINPYPLRKSGVKIVAESKVPIEVRELFVKYQATKTE